MFGNRTATRAVALAGLALATGVVIWLGAAHILEAILKIGWLGLFYVLLWQLAVFVLLSLAWWVLSPNLNVGTVLWARLVREAAHACLPFTDIGGLVFEARVLVLGGVDSTLAAAFSIVDVIAEALGLVPLLVFGLIVLLTRHPGATATVPMSIALGILLIGGVAAFALRRPLAKLLRLATVKLLKPWLQDAPHRAAELEQSVAELLRHKRRIAGGSLLHVLCWFGGAANVWIAYHLLGAELTVVDALAIESILSGTLAVAWLVPAGLGAQELTYVGVGGLFGIPAYLSLAVSLTRRARDILIGAPALLLWQGREARLLRQR
jgi:putative membrane protein